MNKYIILIGFLIILSCKNLKVVEESRKYYREVPHIGESTIIIKGDSFEFIDNMGLAPGESKGNFFVDDNKTFVTSNQNYRSGYMEVEELISPINKIAISYQNTFPLSEVLIIINDEYRFITDDNGIIEYDSKIKKVESIKVLSIYLDEPNIIYKVEKLNSNSFKIKLIPLDNQKIYFDREKIKIFKDYAIFENRKYIRKN